MSGYQYVVDLPEEDGGPEPELRERFAVIIARHLSQLEAESGSYPKVGDEFDFDDTFEGKYVWEMTDAEYEATPPTSVQFEVLAVDPPEPTGSGTVAVTARIPF
jgi:hypothetical protein